MAAAAMQVDLVESPPKPAEARKRQKRQPCKTLAFEEQPEAESKPPVLRRKKGKQADSGRADVAEKDPVTPEVRKPPAPEPIDAEATVTPPPSRRSRKMPTSDKVAPIQLSFLNKSTETAGQPPAPKPKAKSASKGKKPATELAAGKSNPLPGTAEPEKGEVQEQAEESGHAPAKTTIAEVADAEAAATSEVKQDPHKKLLAAFAHATPGIKNGETVLLEEPAAEAATKPEDPPDDQPKPSDRPTKNASKRKKIPKEETAQDAGGGFETALLQEPAVEAAAKPETNAEDQRKASDRPTKNASKRKKTSKEETAVQDAGMKDGDTVLLEPAPEAAPTKEKEAPADGQLKACDRPTKKASKRKKTSKEEALEDAGASDGSKKTVEELRQKESGEAAKSEPSETRPAKDATAKRKKAPKQEGGCEQGPGDAAEPSEVADAEVQVEQSEDKRPAKAVGPKRKKLQEKTPQESGSSPAKGKTAEAWRRFFRRRQPPSSEVKTIVDDEEVIDLEAQKKKQKFDWKTGFAKVQCPHKTPGLLVEARSKSPAPGAGPKEKDLEIIEPSSAAGPKKEAPKPEKVLVDWAEKHAPMVQKDLRPKKAWDQLRDWLKDWRPGGANRQAALVVGPYGCGKTAGVRCLVRRLHGHFLEHDLEEPAGRNFIENMSKKQRDGRQLSDDLVFVCNLNEVPSVAAKEWLAQALQVARSPVIFVAGEGMINNKDTALWKLCLEIRINLADVVITRKLAEVARQEDRPLSEGLCQQVAAASPGDLRRALRMAQLLSAVSTADDACFPEAALEPIVAASQLLGTSQAAEVVSLSKSLDLISLDESVPPLLRWNALEALHHHFPRPGTRAPVAPATGGTEESPKDAAQDLETPKDAAEESEVELEALHACARIASLVAQSDAAAGWAEAAEEKAGTMPSEATGSPASAEPLLLACLSSEARKYVSREARKVPLQLKAALPDPVCPIPADQISMLALQLMVPKAWLEQRVFDWIIATRGSAQTRNVKNFRTWAKRQADRYAARQGWRGMLQPAESMETMAKAAEVDLAEPILLEPEGAMEAQTPPEDHTEQVDGAGAMQVEMPAEPHTEPVGDTGSPQSPAATEVQTSPKSHREPADDAGAVEVEMPPESHTEHVESAGATAVQTAPESCTEQVQGADAAEEISKADV